MNEIMPFYNQLYKSALQDFDPFSNYDMRTEGSTSGTSDQSRDYSRTENTATKATSETVNDTDSTARTVVSTTPQMQLSGNEDYATNLTDSTSNTTAKGTSEPGQQCGKRSKRHHEGEFKDVGGLRHARERHIGYHQRHKPSCSSVRRS